jgi:CheY-like chemotaxis protein
VFDVLVCDIEMPGEDGYALLRAAMGDTGIRPFAAIAVTAHARPADRERTADAGFLLHVAKPLEPQELVAAVASLGRHSRTSAEAV